MPVSTDLVSPELIAATQAYIAAGWEDTVRFCPDDEGTLVGLPFPYTIPSRKDAFQELYYWDTYFTSLGLVGTKRKELARSNARNLIWQVRRFGFVPNGNRTYYLRRSQAPWLAQLVGLVADSDGDDSFAVEALPWLKTEYEFWTTSRITPTGLSRYGNEAARENFIEFFPTVEHRLGLAGRKAEDCLADMNLAMSECESGWDFNHRFDHRCPDFCPVDLNSNLYFYEEFFARHTMGDESADWKRRAKRRRQLLNDLCWNAKAGAWFDYDFARIQRGPLLSAATFQPLLMGLADKAQAAAVVARALPKLEFEFGVAAAAPGPRDRVCQWDYPNVWPCIQYIVYRGLERYGYMEEARRVASKYVASVARGFEKTGDLWEKYNAVDGSTNAVGEAGYLINPENAAAHSGSAPAEDTLPAMMGWTAGVFTDAVRFLEDKAPLWMTSSK